MNVKDLQQFLRSLQKPLSASGGKKVADELERVCAGLEPFSELRVGQFADFLAKADTYARTGVVPTSGRPKAAARPRKTVDPEAVRAGAERTKALYERVTSPEVSYQTIALEMEKLGKEFNKDQVLEIAKAFGISGTLKTKKAALEEIERRMTERKQSYQRTRF